MKLLSWDWRSQIDLDDLGEALTEMAGVHLYQVDTQSDQFAIVLSMERLTAERVQAIWKERWDDEWD